jgi:hypothetical protein
MSAISLSNAQSLAESTHSQLDLKMKANQTKLKLKSLLKNVDSGKYSVNLIIHRQIWISEGRSVLDSPEAARSRPIRKGQENATLCPHEW